MKIQRGIRTTGLAMSLAMFASMGVAANAQDAGTAPSVPQTTAQGAPSGQHAVVEGLIIGRDGSTMLVRTADSPRVTVLLQNNTKATEKGGFLGWSHKGLAVTQLVPGLQVKVYGTYDPYHQLVANKVEFSRGSYNTARQIDAGLNPTNEKVAAQQDQLRSDRRDIEQGQAELASARTDIDATKQGLAANVQATTQNTSAIGQTNTRIGTLDQYATKGTYTVQFANGRAAVKPKYKEELTDFVKQAANTPGAMIEVQGYASKVGNPALNQRLSSERADNVLTIIQQAGVPLTRILAPAAMGTTEQVASNHTRSGQAQNRRVVVTIVVNQGISGGDQSGSTAAPSNPTGSM